MDDRPFDPEVDTLLIDRAKDAEVWSRIVALQLPMEESSFQNTVDFQRLWRIRHLAVSTKCISSLDTEGSINFYHTVYQLMSVFSGPAWARENLLMPPLPDDISIMYGEFEGETLNQTETRANPDFEVFDVAELRLESVDWSQDLHGQTPFWMTRDHGDPILPKGILRRTVAFPLQAKRLKRVGTIKAYRRQRRCPCGPYGDFIFHVKGGPLNSIYADNKGVDGTATI